MAVTAADDSNFKTLLDSNSVVVVKYYADWCGACKLFAPKYNRISNEEQYHNVLFLDVNAEKSPEARKIAGVDNLPFLAAFKDGILIKGGAGSKEEYLRSLIDLAQNQNA
jgi:thiol-disulfide isomerase/thioredoxin